MPAPISTLMEPSAWAAGKSHITWLPDAGKWRYFADPFGIQRHGVTHVFVEAFDYRTQHGVIERHELGADQTWRHHEIALALPEHASYPFIIEDAGEVFMVPENYRSNSVSLYRAHQFPGAWKRECTLLEGIPGAESSLLKHEGRWWMFFTVVIDGRDQRELHLAHADRLTGPWRLHRQNPVIDDAAGARPGGTPFAAPDGVITLPVQDCSRSYGGAICFARFPILTPERVVVEHASARLTGELASSTECEGFHTLSRCGEGTLFDVKRYDRDWRRHVINFRRRLAKRGLWRTA